MKILNVNFAFDLNFGADRNEFLNMKELQKMGHQVSMVTSDVSSYFTDLKNKGEKISYDRPINIFDIPVYVLHCTLPQMGVYCPNTNNLAKKIVKEFDVIHIKNWYDHFAITFYRAAHKHRIPFAFTSHGTLDPSARNKYKKRVKKLIDLIYTKKMLKECGAIHASTDSEVTEFQKFGIEQKKIFRINIGLPQKDFQIKERTNILDRLGIKKDSPYILFLGRIDPKKGIDLLLKAFSKFSADFKDIQLVIAGSGLESYENKIKELTRELGIENRVKFSGFVLGNEKLQLFESAKLFALTTYSDVHPLAVVESLAMGIPVVITKFCDFPEIAEFNAGKIVDADVDSIASAFEQIMENNQNLKMLSNNAKKLFTERFLFEKEPKEYERLYNYAIKNFNK